jgi:hypothetical protein
MKPAAERLTELATRKASRSPMSLEAKRDVPPFYIRVCGTGQKMHVSHQRADEAFDVAAKVGSDDGPKDLTTKERNHHGRYGERVWRAGHYCGRVSDYPRHRALIGTRRNEEFGEPIESHKCSVRKVEPSRTNYYGHMAS